MHLSKEIQRILVGLKSAVKLAETMDGTLPDRYAFYDKKGRSFSAEFAQTDKDFSIVLFERTEKPNYEKCFARGIFNDLNKISKLIVFWVVEQKSISNLKTEFKELEIYQDFDFKNLNPDIEKAWNKVKNRFFNDTKFWNNIEWRNRYSEMLIRTKMHPEFQNLFPFTSHYWLRFSPKKDFITECWTLDTYIVPIMHTKELPKELGNYYVSESENIDGNYFAELNEALDFYSIILKKTEPIKWITNE
ncbi:hypothetical protein ESY86_00010 [Subsaximicrobium wynnwilliamsii]|uniref:Uncharacterized protein n=1 Tax=Subsaximicrobium wynnwilliamsii TaxID=291179 RepID=A0A5C6ZQU7_9FLAO|nr:hypothetical protein [Subsaximicrobium wynnwilliamsii]TXD81653.1 hypothetical protein ESY87_17460 [Subsaximicrobium wynnwilliamsii]TXD91020.1 hypothetical protein ESY86_00010 [Subsaximicrobium wynnwilliamsii]TXE01101.1 hypothetical protein ESY88_17455 [Subsaximicrobium wynnwilliamsii]